jgi:hypothetical protein
MACCRSVVTISYQDLHVASVSVKITINEKMRDILAHGVNPSVGYPKREATIRPWDTVSVGH